MMHWREEMRSRAENLAWPCVDCMVSRVDSRRFACLPYLLLLREGLVRSSRARPGCLRSALYMYAVE